MNVGELIEFLRAARYVNGQKEQGPVLGPERSKATHLVHMLVRFSPGTPVRFEGGLTPRDLLQEDEKHEYQQQRVRLGADGPVYYYVDPIAVTAMAEMVDGVVVIRA